MRLWKTINRRLLCKPNKFLTLELHTIQLPDGDVIDDWAWLILPNFANIIARDKYGRFLMFRQTKYAVGSITLALPGGFLEAGEDPLDGARRELIEETGYTAKIWASLGDYVVDANRGAGKGYFFLALDAEKTSQPIVDDLEEQELLFLTREELEQALDNGQFKVMPWVAAISLALRKLDRIEKNSPQ